MQVKSSQKDRTVFSVFPGRFRPFTDTGATGQDIVVPPGTTIPDLVRMFYKPDVIDAVTAPFSFLSRDLEEKDYKPGQDDPFVFKDQSSLQKFKQEAHRLIQFLNEMAEALGVPLKKDADRGLPFPDEEALTNQFLTSGGKGFSDPDVMELTAFILSNADIQKKFCIVRGSIPGWWASSYSGKLGSDLPHFEPALRALTGACAQLRNTPIYRSTLSEVHLSQGDPLDTNVGWPLFTAAVTKEGLPQSKLDVIQMFRGVNFKSGNAKDIIRSLDEVHSGAAPRGFPLAMAPLRRTQPGYKWNHTFTGSSFGLQTNHDWRGYNTIRIAWMAPYILNLMLSPLQADWKALRMLLPGLYHDGEKKLARTAFWKTQKKLYIMEADYSNYDRNIPAGLFESFVNQMTDSFVHKAYWQELTATLYRDVSIILPDHVYGTRNRGWIFKAPLLGLLSGLKITSEEGTFINAIVCGQSMIDAGICKNESQLRDYWLSYGGQKTPSAASIARERFWIQSDDTLLFSPDPSELAALARAFKTNADRLGLKGSLTLGDRFLMKQTTRGKDAPNPSRVWQNTLSNEDSVLDDAKFLVGLVTRTEGMLGQRTFDPFNVGRIEPTLTGIVRYEVTVLESILSFLETAAVPHKGAIEYIRLMLAGGRQMLKQGASLTQRVKMDSAYANSIDAYRLQAIRSLAERELSKMSARPGIDSLQAWLNQLLKDRHVPSSAAVLAQLEAASPLVKQYIASVGDKEHQFYSYAINTLGISLDL